MLINHIKILIGAEMPFLFEYVIISDIDIVIDETTQNTTNKHIAAAIDAIYQISSFHS